VHHLVWLALPAAALVAAGRWRLAVAWLALLSVGLPALASTASTVSPGLEPVWWPIRNAQGLSAVAAVLLLPRLAREVPARSLH